jgi:hypothetical protein
MVLTDEDLTRAEQEVLSVLQESPTPSSPRAVIERLKDHGFAEPLIRAAIWYLIDRNAVELTWDRCLRRVEASSDFDVSSFASGR